MAQGQKTAGGLRLPRFDSPSVLGALLDQERGRRFRIAPVAADYVSRQLHLPDSAQPVEDHRLVRMARVVHGEMWFVVECLPRFDYGRGQHTLDIDKDGAVFQAGATQPTLHPGLLVDWHDQDVRVRRPHGDGIRARTTLKAGDVGAVMLQAGPDVRPHRLERSEPLRMFNDTMAFWRRWQRGHRRTRPSRRRNGHQHSARTPYPRRTAVAARVTTPGPRCAYPASLVLRTTSRRARPVDTKTLGGSMNDQRLREDVGEEIRWDPKVDAEAVAVSAKDGVVTLRGTVGSFHQKREATKAAERVRGVVEVDNQLDVKIMTDQRRADADIRGDVLQALMLDAWVPVSVDATVSGGIVTLDGAVEHQYQRDEAVHVTGSVPGVVAVENEIELIPSMPDVQDVQHSIKKALERNAKVEAKNLDVATSPGTVTLTGNVHSVYERDAAVAAAWAAPGVRHVDDQLNVIY